jgi:two-component system sensor histidine kinase/response regulator
VNPGRPAPPHHDAARGPGWRILVVDDSALNRELAVQQLRTLGHHAVVAGGGTEALDRIDDSIQLVLMDLNMPDLDGLATTRRLRADGWNTPIVALTAAALAADRAACAEAGMNGFLTKPLGLDALDHGLRAILGHPTAGAAAAPVRSTATDRAVDVAMIEELSRDAGVAAAIMLVRTFLDECALRLERVHAAAADGDETGLRRHAHTLASTAHLVGGTEVHRLARQAEHGGLRTVDDAFLAVLDAACGAMHTAVAAHARVLEAR